MSASTTPTRDDIDAILRSALVRVPGAVPDAARMHLDDALRELTRLAPVWSDSLRVTTLAGARDYQLVPPCANAAVMWVLAAATGNAPLSLVPAPYFNSAFASRAELESGPPRIGTCPSPALLRLYPTPDDAYEIHLDVSLIAQSALAPMPPGIIDAHHETLLDGVLMRFYATPNTPYASARLAEYHGRKFRAGAVDARITMLRGHRVGLRPVVPFPQPAGARGL